MREELGSFGKTKLLGFQITFYNSMNGNMFSGTLFFRMKVVTEVKSEANINGSLFTNHV